MAANQSYGAVSAGSTKRKVGLGLVLAALFATAAVLGRARKAFVSSPAFSSGAADCGDCDGCLALSMRAGRITGGTRCDHGVRCPPMPIQKMINGKSMIIKQWCGDPEPETGESTQKSAEEGEEIDVQPLAPIEPTVEVALPVAPVTPAKPAALDASAFPGEPNPVVQAPPAYDSSGTITNYGDGIIPAEPAPPAENVVELGTVNNHGGMKIIGGEAGPAGIRDMTPEESAAAEQQRAWGQQQLAASKNTLADSQNMLGSGEVAPGYSAGLAY
mmetsp:Transcript_19518/g.61126  ORF Transcript_19518/g.61126 Transcript_19518/m.61126 type:complete len:273 (-) Transcript_19518:613-1431(-)